MSARCVFTTFIQDALHACDMGLIMGRDIDGFSLSDLAHRFHSFLPGPLAPVSLEVSRRWIVIRANIFCNRSFL